MPAWGPQPHQVGSLALDRGGAAGAKLLSRRWFLANATLVVPDGCNWLSGRAAGAGGASIGNGYAGGGAAFAREDRACKPGQSLFVEVPLGATGARRPAASITLDGTVICLAVSGGIPDNAVPRSGFGGQSSECIGTVRYSGGRGEDNPILPAAGENGGEAGVSYGTNAVSQAGGGCAGERNAVDALILGGRGANASQGTLDFEGRGGFPGGGAALGRSDNGRLASPGGDGVVVIEFWSAKP